MIHTISAVIRAVLAAVVAVLTAGVSLAITVLVLGGLLAFALASMFGVGGSRFASKRKARRDQDRS